MIRFVFAGPVLLLLAAEVLGMTQLGWALIPVALLLLWASIALQIRQGGKAQIVGGAEEFVPTGEQQLAVDELSASNFQPARSSRPWTEAVWVLVGRFFVREGRITESPERIDRWLEKEPS